MQIGTSSSNTHFNDVPPLCASLAPFAAASARSSEVPAPPLRSTLPVHVTTRPVWSWRRNVTSWTPGTTFLVHAIGSSIDVCGTKVLIVKSRRVLVSATVSVPCPFANALPSLATANCKRSVSACTTGLTLCTTRCGARGPGMSISTAMTRCVWSVISKPALLLPDATVDGVEAAGTDTLTAARY